ncbi:hypothetical protein [Blastochloris tepida]|uniref:Uncharacterized protein n=1 Tax=Blastochloris tepida TaxID=2233851 RepID=A0A348FXE4_9HYPH|nr:hypothetical protein [Blastochloris tepida]BBF91977.1 hypothetical protein BLTE_06620 [Blastochloris tepida]
MISGRDTMMTVEQAISRARTDEGQYDLALRSAMEQAAILRRTEAEGFRALARIRLDAAVRETVIGSLDASERAALAMIDEYRQRLAALAGQRDEAQRALEQAETEKHRVDQVLAEALDRLEDLQHATAERMRSDPVWQRANARLDAAREIAGKAEEKAAQAEADLSAKRKPYEDDPLFMYLWQRRHGQSEDASGSLVRTIDRWVADLVGYRDARANFAMLQEIPLRLREHADGKRQEFEAAEQEVGKIERAALVAAGVEPLEAAVAAAQADVDQAEVEVTAVTERLAALDAERQAEGGGGDAAVFDKATDMLARALATQDLQDLLATAKRTPQPADDQAVGMIVETRRRLEAVETDIGRLRDTIRDMAERRAELESARDRARRSGYGDPRGTFDGGADLLGEVIGGILTGAIRGAELDRVLRGGFRFPRPQSDPDFGRRGRSPWPGPRGGSGRRADAGFPPSGGGGGGWRTGGGF